MTWNRLATCVGLVGALALVPSIARAGDEMSQVQRQQYQRSVLELLAKARVERVIGEVEVAFLDEQLAGEGWETLRFELEDPLVAELVDSWMTARIEELALMERYGDLHPEMVAVRERMGVLEDTLRQETGSVIEVRRLGVELSRAKEDELAGALARSGGAVDEGTMAPVYAAMAAQLQALQLEARVEAEHHERLLAEGQGEQVARSLGRGGLLVLLQARLERQVEDAELALRYGEQHPERVEQSRMIGALDRLLQEQAVEAVAATRLRVELLQRQVDALDALRGRGAQGEATP